MKHPEKWYIPVTEENHEELDRWRLSKRTQEASIYDIQFRPGAFLLSEHAFDGSYFYTEKVYCRGYQKITLEQFRQITNPHPKHWCIEATNENFSELRAWWKKSVGDSYNGFRVGRTLMSQHPKDESQYYAGDIKHCIADYPQFVEITLEQFRQITNTNQTTMSKQIQISRELLNEYYEAATPPQKEYLSEHFKLDGRTTDEAIRGLHDIACPSWKPRIKKNHPDCFPEDSKYFDFSEHVRTKDKFIISADVCESLGLGNDFIQVRNSRNWKLDKHSFYLSSKYKWELVQDGVATVLIPTKKPC